MNAVLFYVTPTFRLTGSTINAIEYFLAGVEHNPDLKLYLLNGTIPFRRKILKLINDRYDIKGFTHVLHNIENMKLFYLPSIKFDKALVLDYMTITKTKGILRVKKLLVISEKYTNDPLYFYNKTLYNVTYYGEMPFHYKDHGYRMKCLFDRYKPLKEVKLGTYVNSPKNDDFIYEFNPMDFMTCPTPFIFKSKTQPEENLFEKFTHYLYYHANKWFDPHPRLFLECAFYEKEIIYINESQVKDGSWYRYKDIQRYGIEDRTLNNEDIIIRQLI